MEALKLALLEFRLNMRSLFILVGLIGVSLGCARPGIKEASESMRLIKQEIVLDDDLPMKSLVYALNQSIDKLETDPDGVMRFGPDSILKKDYAKSLRSALEYFSQVERKSDFFTYLTENFNFYEVYGGEKWGEVLVTAYFDPVIPGDLKKTDNFSQPLYKTPEDMVSVNISKYAETFPKWKVFAEGVLEQKTRTPIVRGRLVESKNENKVREVVPYYSREEIDSLSLLNGRKLELVYVSPVDAFFLHIQGSGIVRLKNGKELRVGYDSQNGHPYVAIGKFLLNEIPREEMSLQRIENYLQGLSFEEQQYLLNKNPSYVFFRPLKGESQTFMGTDVVEGRTIATDYGIFPKGALALLDFEKPIFATDTDMTPATWVMSRRLVVDHDTGGAIRGPGRLDLYWGKGARAKQSAGVMKHKGRLTYLVPKNISKVE